MAKVLVIGGTAFIGRALVERLLERGDEVVVMHRAATTPFGSRVREIRCDRNDVEAVRASVSGESFDIVYDNVYDWQRGTSGDQVVGTAKALADGLGRYVFTSSVAVYGEGGEYDEAGPLVPSDYPNPYSAQKADSERALFASGLPVNTLRPSFVYGPHNQFDREAFFWDRLLAERSVIVPEDGSATMQWVHADDVAQAAIRAADSDVASGRAYNLAGYPPVTQREFVELLARVAGKEPRLVFVPREQIRQAGGELFSPPFYFGVYLDIPPLTVRSDRVREELGIELRPLEEGLRETFAWYRQQRRPAPDFTWEDRLLASVSS
jgi:2'-hydroxyisoflavone reductase